MLQIFKLLKDACYCYYYFYYYGYDLKPQIFGIYHRKENNGFPSEYHACVTSLRQETPLLFGCAASSPLKSQPLTVALLLL